MSYYSTTQYPPATTFAFGITDRIADFVDSHYALCYIFLTLISFAIPTIFRPHQWVIWLFSALFFAWVSTVVCLLIFGLIEWVVYKIYLIIKHFGKTKD